MRWRFTNDTIFDNEGKIVCTVSANISPTHIRMIKKTPDVMNLVFQFMDTYEAGHKMTKKLYDNLCSLIEEEQFFKISWSLDREGDLIDDKNQKICFFPNARSNDATFILFVPAFLKAIKNNLASFRSTDSKQKPLYQILTKVRQALDEY